MELAATARAGNFPAEPFEFTGNGSEYFRIWIVNLVLSILTLGIYSAWAKVRRQKYFYQHTRLAGGGFDYHGEPIAILKGRLLALVLLITYSLAEQSAGWPLVLALVLIGGLLPLLLRSAFRFRLHYSSYRGLRFSFRGTNKDAYITFLGFGTLVLLTAYIAAPLFHHRLKRYQHGQSWFGASQFRFSAGEGAFFWVYFVVGAIFLLALIGGMVLFGSSFALLGQIEGRADPKMMAPILVGLFLVFMLFSLILAPLFQSRIGNLIWNHTHLGDSGFDSRLQFWPLFFIHSSNFILIVLTLGLFAPWAAVRLARYRAQCLSFLPCMSVEDFVAQTGTAITASGEEMVEMFDFDVGL